MDDSELKNLVECLVRWAFDNGINPDRLTIGEVARILGCFNPAGQAKGDTLRELHAGLMAAVDDEEG